MEKSYASISNGMIMCQHLKSVDELTHLCTRKDCKLPRFACVSCITRQHEAHFPDMIPISEIYKKHLNLNRWPKMTNLSEAQKSALDRTLVMATKIDEEIIAHTEKMFEDFKEGFLEAFANMKMEFTDNLKGLLSKSREIASQFLGDIYFEELESAVISAKDNPEGINEKLNSIFNKTIPLDKIKTNMDHENCSRIEKLYQRLEDTQWFSSLISLLRGELSFENILVTPDFDKKFKEALQSYQKKQPVLAPIPNQSIRGPNPDPNLVRVTPGPAPNVIPRQSQAPIKAKCLVTILEDQENFVKSKEAILDRKGLQGGKNYEKEIAFITCKIQGDIYVGDEGKDNTLLEFQCGDEFSMVCHCTSFYSRIMSTDPVTLEAGLICTTPHLNFTVEKVTGNEIMIAFDKYPSLAYKDELVKSKLPSQTQILKANTKQQFMLGSQVNADVKVAQQKVLPVEGLIEYNEQIGSWSLVSHGDFKVGHVLKTTSQIDSKQPSGKIKIRNGMELYVGPLHLKLQQLDQ